MFRPLWSSVSSDRLRPCIMPSSSWWVSSGGQSTTPWIPTSSTDHLDCAISSMTNSASSPSLLIAVLHALPDSPSFVSSFHNDCAGNPLQPFSTGNSQAHQPLSMRSAMRCEYLRVFLSCASSQFLSYKHDQFSILSKTLQKWHLIPVHVIVNVFKKYS